MWMCVSTCVSESEPTSGLTPHEREDIELSTPAPLHCMLGTTLTLRRWKVAQIPEWHWWVDTWELGGVCRWAPVSCSSRPPQRRYFEGPTVGCNSTSCAGHLQSNLKDISEWNCGLKINVGDPKISQHITWQAYFYKNILNHRVEERTRNPDDNHQWKIR